ncbi:MAG: hypothetical protein C4293_13095 [Nitrospiraceae bacterium]
MPELPPNPNDKLTNILDGRYWDPNDPKYDPEWGWQPLYNDIVLSDLMRLAGWMPKDPTKGTPIDQISPTLKKLCAKDFMNLAKVLEDHTGLSYGHSVYFCCSCV